MSFEAEEIPVREGRFKVRLRRGGEGEPLLYLHGSAGQAEIAPFLHELARSFRVFVPSHPGWDGSSGLERLDDIIDLAIFYLDFLDDLGLDSAHVIGHSLGGMLAAEIAALDPSYVRKLVLCDAAGLWLEEAPAPDFFTMNPDELQQALWFDPASSARPAQDADQEAQARAAMQRQLNLAAAGKFVWPIWDKGLKKRIHRIKAKTLIVWGEKDGLVPPAYGAEFQRLIPGSQLLTIPRAAHLPMLEQPEAFVTAVREFLLA